MDASKIYFEPFVVCSRITNMTSEFQTIRLPKSLIKDLKRQALLTNRSLTQFAMQILIEGAEQVERHAPPAPLPVVVESRRKRGLGTTDTLQEAFGLCERMTSLEEDMRLMKRLYTGGEAEVPPADAKKQVTYPKPRRKSRSSEK